MCDITGFHPISLKHSHPSAIGLKLPSQLLDVLKNASASGERVAFRVVERNGVMQAALTVGISEHHFVGNQVSNQSLLRLTTRDDDNGALVANVTHKLHQRKDIHTSNIGDRIRAKEQAERQKGRQTQLLDHPVSLQTVNGRKQGYRSVTPPAVSVRHVSTQPRLSTPPPGLVARANTGNRAQHSQSQASRLAGRALTPPSSRPVTPPPARPQQASQQQQQQPGQQLQQQPQQQQPQQSRSQPKPVAREPPKPKSLQPVRKQKTPPPPPPPSLQQQQQQQQARPAAAASLGAKGAPAAANAGAAAAGVAAPAGTAAGSAAVTAGTTGVAKQQPAARPSTASGGAAGAPTADKPALQRNGSRPNSRGVSPAIGTAAAAGSKQQQQPRTAMPLISVQPLQQFQQQQSAKAVDRRSPAPALGVTPPPGQQQQQRRLQQQSQVQKAAAAAAGNGKPPASSVASTASKQAAATAGAKQPAAGTATARPASAPSQQQQRALKRPATATSAPQPRAHKLRRLDSIGAKPAASAGAGSGAGSAAARKGTAQQAAQHKQPQQLRGKSPAAAAGQRLSPEVSGASPGGSPTQQQQHTKHWFTSSEESGGVCSVGDAPTAQPTGTAKAAASAGAGGASAAAAAGKRKRELAQDGSDAAAPAGAPAGAAGAARQSWAAMLAKKQNAAAAAKSSWQAALKRSSPPAPQQKQVQQQAPSAAAAPAKKAAAPLDLGPPGYGAFVDRPARSFPPISNQQQYVQYVNLYDSEYAMYISLHKLIEANIASVRSAHEQMAAAALGSEAHQALQAALQGKLTSKAPLTKRWDAAFKTLHQELLTLKQLLHYWTLRGSRGAAAEVQQEQLANGDQQQQRCLAPSADGPRGKGLMLAAPAAVVGA